MNPTIESLLVVMLLFLVLAGILWLTDISYDITIKRRKYKAFYQGHEAFNRYVPCENPYHIDRDYVQHLAWKAGYDYARFLLRA